MAVGVLTGEVAHIQNVGGGCQRKRSLAAFRPGRKKPNQFKLPENFTDWDEMKMACQVDGPAKLPFFKVSGRAADAEANAHLEGIGERQI